MNRYDDNAPPLPDWHEESPAFNPGPVPPEVLETRDLYEADTFRHDCQEFGRRKAIDWSER
jgi:hypothetical protein